MLHLLFGILSVDNVSHALLDKIGVYLQIIVFVLALYHGSMVKNVELVLLKNQYGTVEHV